MNPIIEIENEMVGIAMAARELISAINTLERCDCSVRVPDNHGKSPADLWEDVLRKKTALQRLIR
jgi:hypothetical protein